MLRFFGHYVSTMFLALIAGDLLVIVGAVILSGWIAPWVAMGSLAPRILGFGGVTLFALYLADLYEPTTLEGRREIVTRLLLAVGCTALIAAALGFAVPGLRFARLAFVEIFSMVGLGLLG